MYTGDTFTHNAAFAPNGAFIDVPNYATPGRQPFAEPP